MILAPEYGGDGKTVGRCSQFKQIFAGFPAHYAPVDLMFYTGTQFPAKYRGGAFMTSHGSWNRAPFPMAGYNINFQPVAKGKNTGAHEELASRELLGVGFTALRGIARGHRDAEHIFSAKRINGDHCRQ